MKNLIRKILREEVTIKEVIDDLPQDSYITMNIKNYPKYKKALEVLLKDKLDSSSKDFVKFKKSVVKGYDRFGTAILSDDLKGGDTVYDIKTKKVWSYNGHWDYDNNKNDKVIQLSNDKFETINVPYDYRSNLKVIHRAYE